MADVAPSSQPSGPAGAVREAWLFTCGSKSVRIVRASAKSRMFLHVYGPDTHVNIQEFDDVLGCMRYQSDLERRLVSDGFSLDRFIAERPSGSDRRGASRGPGTDRRQSLLRSA